MAKGHRETPVGILPRVEADLCLGRQQRGLHRHGVGMPGTSSGRIRTGVWQLRTKSRVTVKTKSARSVYMLFRKAATVSIVTSDRRLHSAGPQPFMLLL